MNAITLLRAALSRIVAARESLACDDVNEADTILYDLEVDMAAELATIGDDIVRVRLSDFNDIPDIAA